MRRFALAALAALLVAPGCAGVEERPPLDAPAPLEGRAPLDVPAFRVEYRPTDPAKLQPSRFQPALDGLSVRARLGALLLERGSVAAVTSGAKGSDLLEVTVTDASIRYEGQSALLPVKIAFTVLFFPVDVPNYFISSDRFTLIARARWKLRSANGAVRAEGEAQGRETGTFGDTTRGWYFVGYLRVPQCLDAESWDDLARELLPGCEEALAGQLAMACEKALAKRP